MTSPDTPTLSATAEALSHAPLSLNTWTPRPDGGYLSSAGAQGSSVLVHLSLYDPQVQLVFTDQGGDLLHESYGRAAPLSIHDIHGLAEDLTGGLPSVTRLRPTLEAAYLNLVPSTQSPPVDALDLLRTYDAQFGLRRTQHQPGRDGRWHHAAGLLAAGDAPYFTYGRGVVWAALTVSPSGPTLHFASVDDSGLNLFFPAAGADALAVADTILARCTWTAVPSLDILKQTFQDLRPTADVY